MIPVVISFTPNYIVPAAVLLHSVLSSSAKTDRYEVICMVKEDIPQRQKDELTRMAGERMKFSYLKIAGLPEGAYIDPRYSEVASFRLMLPELLPTYDKVIYVDCDVVVRNNLAELYRNTNLGDNLLGVIEEAPVDGQAEKWTAIGCDPESYFNSGFLLMNLKKMREEGTSVKMLETLKADYLEFPDQDALNKVCQGRTLALSPVFNSIRTFFLPCYKEAFLLKYSAEEWDEVQRHGTVHYTGGKPWNIFTVQFDIWWKEYSALPSDIKAEWSPSAKMKVLSVIYCTSVGNFLIDSVRSLYRKIK